MNHSLEQRLIRILALAIVVVGCLASAWAFQLAYTEAREFQDANLQQIAMLPSHEWQPNQTDSLHLSMLAGMDPEMRLRLIKLNPDGKSTWLPANLSPGFHTLNLKDGNWRVFVRQSKTGYRIAAAQKTDEGDEIAFNSTLITFLPWLLLLPVLIWLSVRIVRRSFAPLHTFAQALETHQHEQPDLLPETGLAKEIAPFVHAINQQTLRIQRNMAQQQRFIADASHELRSPLTALSLQAQNLAQVENCADMRARLVPLQAGIARAQQLAVQLLNLVKHQIGVPNFLMLDMSPWIRKLIAEYLPVAEAKMQDLGLDDPGHILLYTDSDALGLVLRNALDNALRYTPEGGQITLRLVPQQDNVTVEVIDNGPGIPEDEREHVFAPFYRIIDAIPGGSGLGLSIAREAAIRLGGMISLHAGHGGKGLVFRYQQSNPRLL
ncbi:MAG: HAMP domain-containing sensor histidine kinase [Betaproteobacteria bacterium]|nr:HAMP domain-containing sensor histidine kinase [Betaproteobacteria bacterium]